MPLLKTSVSAVLRRRSSQATLFIKPSEKGLTILEVVTSAVLFSLIILGISSVFISTRRHLFRAESQMIDAELGRYFLAPLQMQVMADGCITASNATITGLNNRNYTVNYTITNCLSGSNVDSIEVPLANLTRAQAFITCTNCNWTFY
ncbi:MAG: hypothetical protein ABSB18_08550 [Candidatus Omnitrophota bacterium]